VASVDLKAVDIGAARDVNRGLSEGARSGEEATGTLRIRSGRAGMMVMGTGAPVLLPAARMDGGVAAGACELAVGVRASSSLPRQQGVLEAAG
jgi:hypothetical protein